MRQQHALPPDEELRTDLRNYHDNFPLGDELDRYKFILREFGPPADMLLIGGYSALMALHELKICYVHGFYLACIMLAQVFIEQTLGGFHIIAGDCNLAEKSFNELIEIARKNDQVSSEIAERLHELRNMRNTYTHPKSGIKDKSLIKRWSTKTQQSGQYSIENLVKNDAEQAIQIVVDFLRYNFSRANG